MRGPRRHETPLRIAADHPSLAGHFPGNPVVPGVLLLDAALAAAESWLGRALRPTELPQAKFLAPLLPEQDARVLLELDAAMLRFRIERREAGGDVLLCRGSFALGGE